MTPAAKAMKTAAGIACGLFIGAHLLAVASCVADRIETRAVERQQLRELHEIRRQAKEATRQNAHVRDEMQRTREGR